MVQPSHRYNCFAALRRKEILPSAYGLCLTLLNRPRIHWGSVRSSGQLHSPSRKSIHHSHRKPNISPTISPETDVFFFNVFFCHRFPGSLHPIAIPSLTSLTYGWPSALSGKEKFFSSCARTLERESNRWMIFFFSVNKNSPKMTYGCFIW